jgi:hypothetical protein
MAVPSVVGCILKNSPDRPQFTYDPLFIEELNSITMGVKNKIIFETSDEETHPDCEITYNYLTKDMTFSKPLSVEGDCAAHNILNVRTKASFDKLRVSSIELGVLNKYGTKTAPFDFGADPYGIVQMGPQNKIFFKYDPQQYPAPPNGDGVIFINILLKTCSIFLKDITGVNDIPGATVSLDEGTIRPIDEYPQIRVWGIPPDPDGMCRGMLLFL